MESEAQIANSDIEADVSTTESAAEIPAKVLRLIADITLRFRTLEEAAAVSSFLGSLCEDPQQEIGIHELLINAVEHGNLEITYDEKSAFLAAGRMREEIDHRLTLSRYCDRFVTVEVRLTGEGREILIKDEGPGFDFQRFQVFDPARLFHCHGRGVLLASAALSIEYLPPGNQVMVRIPDAEQKSEA